MKLRNAGRAVVTVTAAVFAISVMGGALGTQIQQDFYDCLEPTNGTPAARQRCCTYAGGAWVEIYDENGDVKDAFCDGAEAGVEDEEEVRTPKTYTTNGTYTSSGTYQPTATPAPTKTASTTATYQQQPTSSSSPTTTSRTTTTTATYSR
jgi:hypothetical protein